MLVGLTGMYCAGKNLVAALLEKRGFPVLDVDKLGHTALESQQTAIFSRFGEDIRNQDGSVNRRLLGARVFGDKNNLADLEAIIHPEANRLTMQWLATHNDKTCIINAALLHKSIVFERLDCIILVNAPLFARLIRAKRRDRLSWPGIITRMWSQRHFFTQYSAGNADIYIVENPGLRETRGFTGIENRINAILSKLEL